MFSRPGVSRPRSPQRPPCGLLPVVLATQSANVGSMRLAAKLGFTEVERFHAWDAEQWLGLRSR